MYHPIFRLRVDGSSVAFMRNSDNWEDDNSIIMTRNLHLEEGQVVSLDLSQMTHVWGNSGYESWFTGHLIYSDN